MVPADLHVIVLLLLLQCQSSCEQQPRVGPVRYNNEVHYHAGRRERTPNQTVFLCLCYSILVMNGCEECSTLFTQQ